MERPAITLRAVTPEDEEFLFRVYAGTRAAEMALVPWSDEEKQRFLEMQFTAQQADYTTRFPDAEHAVILVDGEPHGRIWVHRRPDEIRLLDIALLPEHRNRGTGRVLLERLIADAGESGTPLRHSVYKTNEGALRFYRLLGFEVVEDFETYVLMEWVGR